LRKALVCAVLAATVGSAPAGAGEIALLSHQATYELNLAERSGATSVTSARGLMVMTMKEGCEAWQVRQGLALTVGRDEMQVATVSDFDSEEARDGTWYSFRDRTTNEPGGAELAEGKAAIEAGMTGRVDIHGPEEDEAVLPVGTLFPMAHMVALLDSARAGERIVSHVLFDGTDGALVHHVTTLIGPAAVSADNGLRVWPMRLAFFVAGDAVETPELEIDVRLREDGVAEALAYDYGNFVLSGTLTGLEVLPVPGC